ncbi:rab-GTPase-TBC domain-containing protein [Chlamydoabsidia padenii]|nr:rab-GTPase-TBC domain-containing protein [Chlamydoabsidia padenii]
MQVATKDNSFNFSSTLTTTRTASPLPPPPATMTPEPSKSSTTLAQRRRIPESAEKLKLTADHLDNSNSNNKSLSSTSTPDKPQYTLFNHDTTTTKVSDDILLSHLERQQKALSQLESTTYQPIPLNSAPVIPTTTSNNSNNTDQVQEQDDLAFWTQLVQDYTLTAQRYPSLLLALLSKSKGVPNHLRGAVWQAMAQSNSAQLLTVYEDLAQQSFDSTTDSPFYAMIDHDVNTLYGRKFPETILDTMKKILKVYTLYDPQLDYSTACLSLLVPLLHYVSEPQAFCLFVRLMDIYDMRSMFLRGKNNHVNAVKSRLFEILLGQFCPQLESHLDQHMIRSMHYAGQWYPNLLSSILPHDAVTRIYDLVFALGSIETITRAGLALMQRSEAALMAIGDDSKLLLISVCTSKLFDLGYNNNGGVDAFILDTMVCGNIISNEKLITMMDTLTSQTELQHELTKKMEQHSSMVITQDQNKKKEKRDSWFSSWTSTPSSTVNKQQQRSLSPSPQTQPLPATPTSPSSASFTLRQQNDRTIPLLHQQIEDLVTALSQLQKDHSQLSEEMMTTKLHDMERQVEQSKLMKRNSTLEKKVKKYKMKLTQQQQAINNRDNDSVLNRQDEQYQSFVRSLRLSGNFGALVAGALDNDAPPPSTTRVKRLSQSSKRQSVCSQTQTDDTTLTTEQQQKRDDLVKEVENTTAVAATGTDNDTKAALHAVTSELVTVKLANFEMGQKYEQLCHKYNDMEQALTKANQQVALQSSQIDELVHQLEQSNREKDDFIEEQAAIWTEEQEALLQENEDWMDKVMAAKKTASELHMDKLDLMKQVERQEERIQQLEKEKRDYLMPRDSFTEEVFATHNIFFGQQQQQQQQSVDQESASALEEFRSKYVESDLRCRELEKLLAEAKVKVAEYESNSGLSSMASSICCSPRASLQQRASSLQMKRASTASFLTTCSLTGLQQSINRATTPTSPITSNCNSQSLSSSLSSSPNNNRMSNESCSTTSSVGSHGKRSSMYARICSSFTSVAAPTPVLYEEPQSTV